MIDLVKSSWNLRALHTGWRLSNGTYFWYRLCSKKFEVKKRALKKRELSKKASILALRTIFHLSPCRLELQSWFAKKLEKEVMQRKFGSFWLNETENQFQCLTACWGFCNASSDFMQILCDIWNLALENNHDKLWTFHQYTYPVIPWNMSE